MPQSGSSLFLTDLLSAVGCRNSPLHLKTCREPLRANARVQWRIGLGVLLNTALSKMALQVPFLLHPQLVSVS